jgi:hypothetical protein
MKVETILNYLNNNDIEGLRLKLESEMYKSSLSVTGKQRLSAMKKYAETPTQFTRPLPKQYLERPKLIEYKNEEYYSFLNCSSLVFTKEQPNGIPPQDEERPYPNVIGYMEGINDYMYVGKFNFAQHKIDAKLEGYKLLKKAILYIDNATVFSQFEETYISTALLDISLSILNDGEDFEVYMDKDKRDTCGIFFKNKYGYAYVLPVRKNTASEENKVIKATIK